MAEGEYDGVDVGDTVGSIGIDVGKDAREGEDVGLDVVGASVVSTGISVGLTGTSVGLVVGAFVVGEIVEIVGIDDGSEDGGFVVDATDGSSVGKSVGAIEATSSVLFEHSFKRFSEAGAQNSPSSHPIQLS